MNDAVPELSDLTGPELHTLGDLLDEVWVARAVFAATATFHSKVLKFKTFPRSRSTVVRTQRSRALDSAKGFAETSLQAHRLPSITMAGRLVGVEAVIVPERAGPIRRAATELNTLRRLAAAETVIINATLAMNVPKSVSLLAGPILEMLTHVAHGDDSALSAVIRTRGGAKSFLAAEKLPTELSAPQWAAGAPTAIR